jgi:hypothetical protein
VSAPFFLMFVAWCAAFAATVLSGPRPPRPPDPPEAPVTQLPPAIARPRRLLMRDGRLEMLAWSRYAFDPETREWSAKEV